MSSRKPSFTVDDIFWTDIRREFVENLLKNNGEFLVRKASKTGQLVLSVCWGEGIKHYQPTQDGHTYSLGNRIFGNLEALIHFHFNQQVPLGEALLKTPIKKKKVVYKMADIETLQKLGVGNFGEVIEVKIKEKGTLCAMKTLKENVPKAVRETFIKELGLMETMDHDNVVKCLGVVDDGDGRLRILLEMINQGSLDKLLRGGKKLTNRGKVRVIVDVAKGMQYLHKMGIIHRDLAVRNILVQSKDDGRIVAKVSDFGLSRHDDTGRGYELKSAVKLPLKWLAPECFRAKRWTKASGVWSFGVLMWEVFTNSADPYYDVPEAQGFGLARYIANGGHEKIAAIATNIGSVLKKKKKKDVSRPEGCRDDMWELMLKIFTCEDSKRITMDDVVTELEKIYAVVKTEDPSSRR